MIDQLINYESQLKFDYVEFAENLDSKFVFHRFELSQRSNYTCTFGFEAFNSLAQKSREICLKHVNLDFTKEEQLLSVANNLKHIELESCTLIPSKYQHFKPYQLQSLTIRHSRIEELGTFTKL